MDDESRFDQVKPGAVVVAAAAAAGGTLIDLAGAGSTAGAVSAVSLQALGNLVGWGVERRRHRAARALDEACSTGGVTPDQLLDRALASESRAELMMRALAAAAQATTEQKITALGRAVATGVLAADEAVVDQELFVIEALSRFEAPHVRMLDLLSGTSQPQRNGVIYQVADLAWSLGRLQAEYPQARDSLPAVIATLVATGAAEDAAVGTLDYHPAYQATEFGRRLLARLKAVDNT